MKRKYVKKDGTVVEYEYDYAGKHKDSQKKYYQANREKILRKQEEKRRAEGSLPRHISDELKVVANRGVDYTGAKVTEEEFLHEYEQGLR